MRGPLIAKDDPSVVGSRFPRVPMTSDDKTMQSVGNPLRRAWEEKK